MRITGGQLSGRTIRVPGQGMRPTQDRVRLALFNMLGASIPGCRFLDLFAGSGAVGLEAFSRGAEFVAWVEVNRASLAGLRRNVQELGANGEVVAMDVSRFLKQCPLPGPFHYIFADPPYREDWRDLLLAGIQTGGLLVPGGCFIFEQSAAGRSSSEFAGWRQVDERRYGDSILAFFRPSGSSSEANGERES